MKVTIVGVKKSVYKGKDGQMKSGYNYCGLKDFTSYEMESADCEGQDIIREWSSVDFNVHVGDVVEFIYEPGYQDKAMLVDVRMIEAAGTGNPFEGKTAQDKAAEPKDSKDKNKVGA